MNKIEALENLLVAALVVAHGGPLRILICCLTGLDLSAWRQVHVERASLSVIQMLGHSGTVLVLNDVSHLGFRENVG